MWWNGQQLTGSPRQPIAFDTETMLIQSELEVPALALGMAYDGTTAVLIHPDRIGDFFTQHRTQHFVLHNAAFDFWVLAKHLPQRDIWDSVNANRWHDTMLLDMLIQLATGDYRPNSKGIVRNELIPANLAVLSRDCGGMELDKADPYRVRYGELIGLSEAQIEAHPEFKGFSEYAMKDVLALHPIYPKLYDRAVSLMTAAGWKRAAKTYSIRPDALTRFGPLSEAVQVKGAIALAHVSRQPLCIDQGKREALETEYRRRIAEGVAVMDSFAPDLFKRTKPPRRRKGEQPAGEEFVPQMIAGEKRGLPKMSTIVLQETLKRIAAEKGLPLIVSTGKKKGLSVSAKAWAAYKDSHPFLKAWTESCFLADRVKFLVGLHDGKVWSRYEVLKVTGRTSARKWPNLPGLNIQQVPKDDSMRELFRASADDSLLLIACDWSAVELVTLSSICKAMFGQSVMADAIGEGKDLHVLTAQRLLNSSPAEWEQHPKETKLVYRQSAKPCNFGFPGGLGIKRFIDYAKAQYNVTMTEAEAKVAKKAWMAAYPEMKLYLSDVTPQALYASLRIHPEEVRKTFGERLFRLGEALSGDYDTEDEAVVEEMEGIFGYLQRKAKGSRYYSLFLGGPSEHLKEKILGTAACTLTGRIRADCGYTDGKNTPFQGLAADGAKEALWQLLYCGLDVRAFVHDEILVAVPKEKALTTEKQVVRLMCRAMEAVCGQGVPATAKASVDYFWRK